MPLLFEKLYPNTKKKKQGKANMGDANNYYRGFICDFPFILIYSSMIFTIKK